MSIAKVLYMHCFRSCFTLWSNECVCVCVSAVNSIWFTLCATFCLLLFFFLLLLMAVPSLFCLILRTENIMAERIEHTKCDACYGRYRGNIPVMRQYQLWGNQFSEATYTFMCSIWRPYALIWISIWIRTLFAYVLKIVLEIERISFFWKCHFLWNLSRKVECNAKKWLVFFFYFVIQYSIIPINKVFQKFVVMLTKA